MCIILKTDWKNNNFWRKKNYNFQDICVKEVKSSGSLDFGLVVWCIIHCDTKLNMQMWNKQYANAMKSSC